MLKSLFLMFFMVLTFTPLTNAADTTLKLESATPGAQNQQNRKFAPGCYIILPGGVSAIVEEYLENGDLLTNLGLTISPEGILKDGPDQGLAVKLDPDYEELNQRMIAETSEARTGAVPGRGSEDDIKKAAQQQKSGQSSEEQTRKVVTKKETTQAAKEDKKTSRQEKQAQEQKSQSKTEKPQPAAQARAEKSFQPPKPGQPMRIPPESIKTGNLDFLEGCWEGTRPEYVTKRTVKECFCFGAGGKNGKRRINDKLGGRQCIGPTRARLSSDGILSVSSESMPCNDGERWGGAEMVCRNSGPRTPCSWIFTDANNGRQAYEIPFIRVQSCAK